MSEQQSSPVKLPVRLTLRTVNDSELPTSIEELLRSVRRDRISAKKFVEWLNHPDERVQVEAIRRLPRENDTALTQQLRQMATLRALTINMEEGIAWNPLLDEIQQREKNSQTHPDWVIQDTPLIKRGSLPKVSAKKLITSEMNSLASAIAGEADGAILSETLKSRSDTLITHLARAVRPMPAAMLRAALHDGNLMQAVLRSSALSASQASALRMEVIGALLGGKSYVGKKNPVSPASLVVQLVRGKHFSPVEAADLLLSQVPVLEEGQSERSSHHPVQQLIRAACEVTRLNEAQIRRVAPYMGSFYLHWLPDYLAQSAQTPIEVLHAIVGMKPKDEALFAIVKNQPKMAGDPIISRALPSKDIPLNIWEAIFTYGSGHAFRYVFIGYLEQNAQVTMELLAERVEKDGEGVLDDIYTVDLAPALASSNPLVREMAIRLSGQLKQGKPKRARRTYV